MKTRLGVYVSTILITLTAATASADLLLYDGFDYTAGQLLAPTDGTAGQLNPGGANWYYAGASGNNPPGIGSGSLGYANVAAPGYDSLPAATGNSVQYDTTQNASARIQLTPAVVNNTTTVGTYYYSYLFRVNNLANMTVNLNGLFLASFNNGTGAATSQLSQGSALTRMRVDGTDNTKYNLGIAKSTATASGLQYSGPLTVGDTLFVVAAYEFVSGTLNDVVSLWINPDATTFGTGSPPSADLTAASASIADLNLWSIALRNVNTIGNPAFQVDELRVGTSWADVTPVIPEPGTMGLLGLGMLLLGWHRRSRVR